MEESIINKKKRICKAGRTAVDELIKIAEEPLIHSRLNADNTTEDGLAADKLVRAAQSKKLAIFDALEILNRVQLEELEIEALENGADVIAPSSFAERKAKGK
jgi:hypothetical protein